MIVRFKLHFSWTSAITFRVVQAVCVHSAHVDLGSIGSRNEGFERHSLNTIGKGTTLTGLNLSLHAFTA